VEIGRYTIFEKDRSLSMNEIKRKSPLSKIDIVILVILTPLVFWFSYMSLVALIMGRVGLLLPDWVFTIWGLVAILSFDIIWIFADFLLWPHKHIKIKAYFTAFILSLSASILLSLWVAKGFSESMH
jgi:hypothetical protein